MDRIKRTRRPLRTSITKVVNELETELAKDVVDRMELQVKFKKLEEIVEEVSALDHQYLGAMIDAKCTDDEYDAEYTTCEEYKDKARIIKERVNDVLVPHAATVLSSPSSHASGSQAKRNYKLPKIELRKFDGKLKDWLPFWAQFAKIHDDEDVDEADKFQYLMQSMTKDSRAEELVSSYPQTAQNYNKVISALKSRFGNDKLLRRVYVRELIQLIIKNASSRELFPPSKIYDKIEAHLRALESLGIKAEKNDVWLYPMVESCLSDELLRAWERSPLSSRDGSLDNPPKTDLDLLMDFLRGEVEAEDRIKLARSGIGPELKDKKKGRQEEVPGAGQLSSSRRRLGTSHDEDIPTAAGLFTGKKSNCIFCDKNHASTDCLVAHRLSLKEKKDKIKEKKYCFNCVKPGHSANVCKAFVKCFICGSKHHSLVCPEPKQQKSNNATETRVDNTAVNASQRCRGDILLKTVVVKAVGPNGNITVRLVSDEGSQTSHIGSQVVQLIGSPKVGEEFTRNVLFGGTVTAGAIENFRQVNLESLNGRVRRKWTLRERQTICPGIPRIPSGPWIEKLKAKNIWLSDWESSRVDNPDVQILIGQDLWNDLVTGRRFKLGNGLAAVETIFGWTLCGPLPSESIAMANISLIQTQASIQDLWNLESIGITDSIQVKSQEIENIEAKQHFQQHVTRCSDGRYQVSLPWMNGQEVDLPNNQRVAESRLRSTTKRLLDKGSFQKYHEVVRGWLEEGLVEVFDPVHVKYHLLPHHPVFKPQSTTTPVRPVFDASFKFGRNPSLNDCLFKGPNLIEEIPAVLNRFRRKMIGVTADIRKAFQMIAVREEDRNYQSFLWWKDEQRQEIIKYRHTRVVFGITSSPFLLAAVLELHLHNVPDHDQVLASELRKSLYVDNCLTSVDSVEEYQTFHVNSVRILATAQMELREWGRTGNDEADETVSVLGLMWNKHEDYLTCNVSETEEIKKLTKRKILSEVHKIFDPIGFTCPATLRPKILLQQAWKEKAKWDDEVGDQMKTEFMEWYQELPCLNQIQLPRQMMYGRDSDLQIHTFTDASKAAYGTVVFIRSKQGNSVHVNLAAAKARVSPVEKATIPRLELMGCLLGARMTRYVVKSLGLEFVPVHYWCDSTTALAWIRRSSNWGTFVSNRVKEILELSKSTEWKYVPGSLNPADLPSRGCSPKQLLKSRWWEGPTWLRSTDKWPSQVGEVDEKEISREQSKSSMTTRLASQLMDEWFRPKFSSFYSNVRVLAWVLRFVDRVRGKGNRSSALSIEEFKNAENQIVKIIQGESFPDGINHVCKIKVLKMNDVYRVKSKLLHSEDDENFRLPYLLPKAHPLVDQLIHEFHVNYNHAGAQFLLGKLREKFWILQGRRSVKRIIQKCSTCRRYDSRPISVEEAALPPNRVASSDVFQTTGVDLAGPLYLKDGSKCWIVLFTCAVYRAVDLDVVTSLSSQSFLGALERFINSHGLPTTIYSDNGTNFVATAKLLQTFKWIVIERLGKGKSINWIFNPPSAAWWGGWWERLIRSVKDQLRRMLGKAKLTYDELRNCLSSVAAVINDRPLTTVTEDGEDLIPLTPAMFLHPLRHVSLPMGTDPASQLQTSYRKMKTIQQNLKDRFRKEYLSQLVQKAKEKTSRKLNVGDIILVGSDNKKRFEWPLGKIVELIPGRDGVIRVAKVKTSHGILTRPLQRLYPLEISTPTAIHVNPEVRSIAKQDKINSQQRGHDDQDGNQVMTRVGRVVKKPSRYNSAFNFNYI